MLKDQLDLDLLLNIKNIIHVYAKRMGQGGKQFSFQHSRENTFEKETI